MGCLVFPVSILKSKCMGSRLSYQPLTHDEVFGDQENQNTAVTVVVGKEKREFLVDPFVLQENPFRVLIDTTINNKEKINKNRVLKKKNKMKKTKICILTNGVGLGKEFEVQWAKAKSLKVAVGLGLEF
ncbi:hypothetical protein F8388_008521 [Cannabis sativa]|uniref:Uncharacterized protein n=1 Tax=Cannabis sativa TaxID=3483 RepID=A0A7J6EHW8_CANSA|nr:hypothetical protein F8388_008521 [Cannabis sativa]